MSIWISKTCFAPLLLSVALLLSGCVVPDLGAGLLAGGKVGTGVARQSFMELAGLKVAGPSGFCPVASTRQRVSGADFAALAPCNGTAGAILTITIAGPQSAEGMVLSAAALRPYFNGPEGRAALRGAASSDKISLHSVADTRGAVVLHLSRVGPRGADTSWRALMQVQGRLITLSVRPRQGKALPFAEGQRLIGAFIAAMGQANSA